MLIFPPYVPIYSITLHELCANRPEIFPWNISTLSIISVLTFREYKPERTATTWFTTISFPKTIYFQFVQRLGVCLHIGKHTLYFEGSFNVGMKIYIYISPSLTYLITLPQPRSVMHAKCCLWETAWGTTSQRAFERGLLTLKLVYPNSCRRNTAQLGFLPDVLLSAAIKPLLAFKKKEEKIKCVV